MIGSELATERRKELRSKGVFPWSGLAVRACIVAGVLGSLLAIGATIDSLVSTNLGDVNLSVQGIPPNKSSPLYDILRSSSAVIIATSAAALVSGIFAVVIQTRGAVSGVILGQTRRQPRQIGLLTKLIGLPLSLGIGVLAVYFMLPELVTALREGESSHVAHLLLRLAERVIKLVVVVMVVLAVLLVFVSRLRFPLEARWVSRRESRQ